MSESWEDDLQLDLGDHGEEAMALYDNDHEDCSDRREPFVIDISDLIAQHVEIIDQPTSAAGDVARTHYTLGDGGAAHFVFSPNGIVTFRRLLWHAITNAPPDRQQVVRPCLVANWRAEKISIEQLGKFNCFDDVTVVPRLVLDLDWNKQPIMRDIHWPTVVSFLWSAVCTHSTTLTEDDALDAPRYVVFAGNFADKAISAHVYFVDYCSFAPCSAFVDAVNAVVNDYSLEYDTSVYNSGVKYPFMDKYLHSSRSWRCNSMSLVDGDASLVMLCDPLAVIGMDEVILLSWPVDVVARTVNTSNRRRIAAEGVPVTSAEQRIADMLVRHYHAVYDEHAQLQSGSPKVTNGNDIRINFRDSPSHVCQHNSNNHYLVYNITSGKGFVRCGGADVKLHDAIDADMLRVYDDDETAPMQLDDSASHYDIFRDWLIYCVVNNVRLQTDTPVYLSEVCYNVRVYNDMTAAERSRMFDYDECSVSMFMDHEIYGKLWADPAVDATIREHIVVAYANLCFCYCNGKYFLRTGPFAYEELSDKQMGVYLASFRYDEMIGKRTVSSPFIKLWTQSPFAYRPFRVQAASVHEIALYPSTPQIFKRFLTPAYPIVDCMFAYEAADRAMRQQVADFWQHICYLLCAGLQELGDFDADYVHRAMDLLTAWTTDLLFGSTPAVVGLHIHTLAGGSGKTFFAHLLMKLLGFARIYAPTSIEEVSGSHWRTAWEFVRLIYFDDTMNNTGREKTAAWYKSYTANADKHVFAERKYGNHYAYRWWGTVMITSNKMLSIPGVTEGDRRTLALRALHSDNYVCAYGNWHDASDFWTFAWRLLTPTINDGFLKVLCATLYRLHNPAVNLTRAVQDFCSPVIEAHLAVSKTAVERWVEQRFDGDNAALFVTDSDKAAFVNHRILKIANDHSIGDFVQRSLLRFYSMESLFAVYLHDMANDRGPANVKAFSNEFFPALNAFAKRNGARGDVVQSGVRRQCTFWVLNEHNEWTVAASNKQARFVEMVDVEWFRAE